MPTKFLLFLMFCSVSFAHNHQITFFYSDSNNSLDLNFENRKFYENGQLESIANTDQEDLKYLNSFVDIEQKSKILGVTFLSKIHLKKTNLQYGISVGLGEKELLFDVDDAKVLSYKSDDLALFAGINILYTYMLENTNSITAEADYKYFSGDANKVFDLNFGIDHPDFVTTHNNRFNISETNLKLLYNFKYSSWLFNVGLGLKDESIKYFLHKTVEDIVENEDWEEVIDMKFEFEKPYYLIFGLNRQISKNLSVAVLAMVNDKFSFSTNLSYKF